MNHHNHLSFVLTFYLNENKVKSSASEKFCGSSPPSVHTDSYELIFDTPDRLSSRSVRKKMCVMLFTSEMSERAAIK